MSAHTPGPWTVHVAPRIGNYAGGFSVEEDHTGNVICGRAGWPTRAPESEANARLIAAAPDLLDACKVALGAFECHDAIDWDEIAAVIAEAERGVVV